MNDNEILQAMGRYKFYHCIKLTDSITTPGWPAPVPVQNLCLDYLKTLDLKDKRVLDIGCRDGLFSFAAESMGASEVIGIDNDLSKGATEFLIPFLKSKVRMFEMNVYDLKPESFGLFDVVIFPGVLYHLRYPFWSLKAIRDVLRPGGHLIIETPIWRGEKNNAMLFCPIGDESPYEGTSCTFFNEKGLIDTLRSMGFKDVSIRYLKKSGGWFPRLMEIKYSVQSALKMRLNPEGRSPIRFVTRSVSHFIYKGDEKNTFTTQYWERNHNHHNYIGC